MKKTLFAKLVLALASVVLLGFGPALSAEHGQGKTSHDTAHAEDAAGTYGAKQSPDQADPRRTMTAMAGGGQTSSDFSGSVHGAHGAHAAPASATGHGSPHGPATSAYGGGHATQ